MLILILALSMIFKYKNESLTSLIKKIKDDDREALEELIRREQTNIYAALRYLGVASDDILDLTQEILVKISKNIKNLKKDSMYKYWSNQIAIRHFYDYLRKKKRFSGRVNVALELDNEQNKDDIPDYSSNPIKDVLSQELDELIKNSISKLPDQYKIAIIMRELQGLSYEQISKVTKTNIGTVKSRIARARERLQQDLKQYLN